MSDIATQRDPIAPDDKIRQTYAQDWPAYDAAKTNEDVLFKRLMQELLLLAVENPSPQRTGRPSFDTRTKLFAMAIKTYYKSDLRKTTSILKELHHLKLIPATPCYKSIDNFFNDASLGPVLDHLILLTALPLADVERVAAMDSTGFGMRKYDSWQATKWGTVQTGRQRSFRKLHAVVGCKTNIFVSVEVTEKNVADVTMLPSVVGNRPKYFDFQDFVADKAYSSRAVYKFLDKLGLDTYIPFKRGSSSRAGGARHCRAPENNGWQAHRQRRQPREFPDGRRGGTVQVHPARAKNIQWAECISAGVRAEKRRSAGAQADGPLFEPGGRDRLD